METLAVPPPPSPATGQFSHAETKRRLLCDRLWSKQEEQGLQARRSLLTYWLYHIISSTCSIHSLGLWHWNKEDSWCLAKTLTNTTLVIPHDWLVHPPTPTHTPSTSLRHQLDSLHFSSDTMYLEVAPGSHKLRTQSRTTAFTSDADPKSQLVSCISDVLTINWISLDLLHGSSNLLGCLTELREILLPEYCQRYNKRYKWTATWSSP